MKIGERLAAKHASQREKMVCRRLVAEIGTVANDGGFGEWTAAELRVLAHIRTVQFFLTRFAGDEIMRPLGIKEQVEYLLNRMGISANLASMDEITYPEAARQFLSTVEYKEDEDGDIHFRLGSKKYSIKFNLFCSIYGLAIFRKLSATLDFRQASELWRNIAIDETFHPETARMSKVRNPTIRYVLRLIENTLFARAMPGCSTIVELGILHRAIGMVLSNREGMPILEEEFSICTASMFLNHLLKIQRETSWMTTTNGIYIGGMLTPIFRAVGIDLSRYEALPERNFMDEDYLKLTGSLAGRFHETSLMHRFMDNDRTPLCCFLPNASYTDTCSNDCIQFRIPKSLYFSVYFFSANPKQEAHICKL